MEQLIKVSLDTMRKADIIRINDKNDFAEVCERIEEDMGKHGVREYKKENQPILNTKILIAHLYDDICRWLCFSKTYKNQEELFKDIVISFIRFSNIDKDTIRTILKEELK